MTVTTSTANSGIMQTGQHSMPNPGNAPGTPAGQGDQQQAQQQLMSPQAGQQVQMGQAISGAFPQTIIQSPMGQPQVQYVVVNQHGQQMLQPAANYSFHGMATMPAQQQQAGQQYIITAGLPTSAKQGGQQPQLMATSSPAASGQSTGKAMSQATPTYTLTSSGIVAQSGGAPAGQTFMIAPQMGGSPTLQGQSIMPNSSLPSHIKAEPGKNLPPSQQTSVTPQAQQVGAQQPIGIMPSMVYGNQTVPGQAFMSANGQIIIRAPGSQDGQAQQSQLMFSPQGLQMQSHPQAGNLQPNMATQQLPPGLTTSMQPVTMTSTTSGGTSMVRPPMAYASQPPAGKTQISRAPPTLLPATSTSTIPTSRSTTSTPFMAQPSPKSKQKMSPRTTTQQPLAAKGGLSATSAATKSILNTIKNQSVSSVSPPVLSSTLPTGGPSGPPVLQTPLSAPPTQASNSQPPLLHPMTPNPAASMALSPAFINGGKPTTLVPSLTTTKVPILPNNQARKGVPPPVAAAPMEPVSKPINTPEVNGKRPQECLTHVIDGHVIHESSQPFPLEDDPKSRQRKKPEVSKNLPTTSNITTNTTSVAANSLASNRPNAIAPNNVATPSPNKFENEKKRGPGRPPGSTRQNIEQQRVNNLSKHPGAPVQPASSDIVKVNNKDGPPQKKAKTDFEKGPPALNPAAGSTLPTTAPTLTQQPSEVKAKYNIDVLTNNPLKWSVTQVCDFVKNLPGCSDYVEDFQLQEIDGQALMLLKADHLMSAMAIKLGPALKICNAIEAMREELKQNCRRAHRKRVLFKLGTKLVGEVDVIEQQQQNEDNNNNDSSDSMLSKASVYDENFSDIEEPE